MSKKNSVGGFYKMMFKDWRITEINKLAIILSLSVLSLGAFYFIPTYKGLSNKNIR